MKLGDRVNSPMGPGAVIGFEEYQGWRRIGVLLDKAPAHLRNGAWFYPRDNVTFIV